MIVRLKASDPAFSCVPISSFQFYDSPIKRIPRSPQPHNRCWFQFYDSPIKRKNRMRLYRPSIITFQFYDSPIKRSPEIVFIDSVQFSFNSMIVRLKAETLRPTTQYLAWFQFYDSPIKRQLFFASVVLRIEFQFYDSPIKSILCAISTCSGVAGFNSMIVRLKGKASAAASLLASGFNSMIVRLKVKGRPLLCIIFFGFNSMIVRLKGNYTR